MSLSSTGHWVLASAITGSALCPDLTGNQISWNSCELVCQNNIGFKDTVTFQKKHIKAEYQGLSTNGVQTLVLSGKERQRMKKQIHYSRFSVINSKLSQFCFYNICPKILHLHRAASWFEYRECSYMSAWDTTPSLTQVKSFFLLLQQNWNEKMEWNFWSAAI